jgi:hypothetical protein
MKYNTEERDHLRKMAHIYGTNPFNGKCYVEEVTMQKKGQVYYIYMHESVAEKYLIPQEFLDEHSHTLLMIKPVDGDDNYIFFRRL